MLTKSRAVKPLSKSSYLIRCAAALGLVLGGSVVGAAPASADPAGGYRIQSQASGRCLDVRHYGAYGAYANVCNGYNNQRWHFDNRQGEMVSLRNGAGNACLSARDDTGITVEACNPGDFRQRFRDMYSDGTRHVFMSHHGSHLQNALHLEPDNNVGTRKLQRGTNINNEYAMVFVKVYPF